MGWGIDFKANVYLSRQIYSNKEQVEDAITEKQKAIKHATEQLLILVAGNPKDLLQTEGELVFEIQSMVSDLIETICEEQRNITLLNLFVDEISEGNYKFEEQKNE